MFALLAPLLIRLVTKRFREEEGVEAFAERADPGHAGAHYSDVDFEEGPHSDGDEVFCLVVSACATDKFPRKEGLRH
jgi:hypothetical protein